VLRQPVYVVAVAAAVVSYAVMSFIMTATPISMHVHDHHTDTQTAWVIQSHLLAMYAPSLVSGRIIGGSACAPAWPRGSRSCSPAWRSRAPGTT